MLPCVCDPRQAGTPVSHPPLSLAVRVANLVLVSGQAWVDATGNLVSGDFEGEFRRSAENPRKVLQSAGAELARVVRKRNDLRDAEHLLLFDRLDGETSRRRIRPAP